MQDRIRSLLFVVIFILLVGLLAGIILPNKFYSSLQFELPVNSGTAFRVLSQAENYPYWFLINYHEKDHLSWVSGVDGTKGARLHWERQGDQFIKGQTTLIFINPLQTIELQTIESGKDYKNLIDKFSITSLDHLRVGVNWERAKTVQFPFHIPLFLKNEAKNFQKEHQQLKDQLIHYFSEKFPSPEINGFPVLRTFLTDLNILYLQDQFLKSSVGELPEEKFEKLRAVLKEKNEDQPFLPVLLISDLNGIINREFYPGVKIPETLFQSGSGYMFIRGGAAIVLNFEGDLIQAEYSLSGLLTYLEETEESNRFPLIMELRFEDEDHTKLTGGRLITFID